MKSLSIAFIWHFHQPNYQKTSGGDFLLPWVRLHASKDYLDMLKRIDKFKNIRLNFSFSPVLLEALQGYSEGIKDTHLNLLLKDEKTLSEEDKIFILNNYFDLNYKNMVLKRPYFTELYNKRANAKVLDTSMFSLQEYADIIANYTICWIDEMFFDEYPGLLKLSKKEKKYTLSDRRKIYQIQLDMIKRILIEYKNYQNENKIEVLTSPYYHPVLPLLIDLKGKEIKDFENLPENLMTFEDAKEQVELAISKYEEIFDKKPKGMWLSEQCICPKTTELLNKSGITWTAADEGILVKTLKREFIRDFEGNLENPHNLTINYITKARNPLNILFADSFFANLINFGYGNYDPEIAANDVYEKIKTIQIKLQNSPRENYILTIAMDGENCWETYPNDGAEFLDTLYGLIDNDDSLKTVLVSDFIQNNKPQPLDNLKSGSWINRNFDLWIGEPVKNAAWLYLKSVREDLENYKKTTLKTLKTKKEQDELIKKYNLAHREILIAQGSDWYWWYGEPNESKSDGVFDYLFRSHLRNVYEIMGLEIPDYLTISLVEQTVKSLRNPVNKISPSLVCDANDTLKEWKDAGCIFIPDSPTSNVSRLIKNIQFGFDDKNLYFRFELNKNSKKIDYQNVENQIAIYFADENSINFSPIRFVSKNDNIYPIIKNQFSRELRFVFDTECTSRIFLNKSCPWGLWCQLTAKNCSIEYKNKIAELKISLAELGFNDRRFSFCVIDASNELINEIYPQDILVDINF